MNRDEAHALLNCAAAGDDFSSSQIMEALYVTGDVRDNDDFPAQRVHRAIGTWERSSVPTLLRLAQPFDGITA